IKPQSLCCKSPSFSEMPDSKIPNQVSSWMNALRMLPNRSGPYHSSRLEDTGALLANLCCWQAPILPPPLSMDCFCSLQRYSSGEIEANCPAGLEGEGSSNPTLRGKAEEQGKLCREGRGTLAGRGKPGKEPAPRGKLTIWTSRRPAR